MKQKKTNSLLKLLLKSFFVTFIIFVCFFTVTKLAVLQADKLLVSDQISQAQNLYKIARLNPFLKDLNTRLLATDILTKERAEENEETGTNQNIAFQNNQNKQVLGTNIAIPVLMYHYIRINPRPSDRAGFNLSVTPANFTAQMDYLASQGYHTVSLDEMGNALINHGNLPTKPIVITFDDGYADSYFNAFPILKNHGFKATNFVITGLVGAPNYLTWAEINEMKNSGVFTFGAHTVHHFSLTSLSASNARYEISESKNSLQTHLGVPINWFAYPYGNINDLVANITNQSGFMGAFGTNYGKYESTDRMFSEPRIRIGGSDTLSSFAKKIAN